MFNVFGSKDSLDYDIMVVINHDSLDSIEVCHTHCDFYAKSLSRRLNCSYEEINVNLCNTDNGRIVKVFKGTPDECNNSIYRTYKLHKQYYPCIVEYEVDRCVATKIQRAVRVILSFLSRTEYRTEIKAALKSKNLTERLATLLKIDFTDIKYGSKNGSFEDINKQIAFQIAQTLELIKGNEIYTKGEASYLYPELYPFFKREIEDTKILNLYKNKLVSRCIEYL